MHGLFEQLSFIPRCMDDEEFSFYDDEDGY